MDIDYARIDSEQRLYGLVYGALAGFVFSLVCWGIDAFILAQSQAMLPWMQWAIGGSLCTLIGAAAGLLCQVIKRILASFIIWLGVGVAFSWLAGHVPFTLYTAVLRLVAPDTARLVSLPYSEDAAYRMVLPAAAIMIASVVAGLLINLLVDSTQESTAPLGAVIPLALWIAIFGLAGLAPETSITALVRAPVTATHQVIVYTLDNQGKPVDQKTANDLGLRAIDPLKGIVSRSHRILLSGFQEDLLTANVVVDFDGSWASCSVLNSRPSYCKPTPLSDLYQPQ